MWMLTDSIPDWILPVQLEAFLRSRRPATIQVRMRGLHLLEGHFLVDGQPISAGLLYVHYLTLCPRTRDTQLFSSHLGPTRRDCGATCTHDSFP